MNRSLEELLKKRRSRYKLEKEIGVSDECIVELLQETVKQVPSTFNSQSTRLVLLLGDSHSRFWQIVLKSIAGITTPEAYEKSKQKIETAFAGGHGTILFFEDSATIEKLKKEYPLYAKEFQIYSEHTSAMHQIVVWLLLADANIGASLQHYEQLVEKDVKQQFSLPESWKLIAQMPFGNPTDTPPQKSVLSFDQTIRIFS
jgi:predicted oxidoreductase (fatty acid repression mutant protein)